MKAFPASASRCTEGSLFAWLARAARRVRMRQRVREAGRLAGALFGLLGIYRLLELSGVPDTVLQAVCPLLLLAALAALARCAWVLACRPRFSAVAAEVDARAGLKDELKSACWFASRNATTPWEALLLERALRRLRDLDPAAVVPLRWSGSPALAGIIATLVLALGFLTHPGGSGGTGVRAEATIVGPEQLTAARPGPGSLQDSGRARSAAGDSAPRVDGNSSSRQARDAALGRAQAADERAAGLPGPADARANPGPERDAAAPGAQAAAPAADSVARGPSSESPAEAAQGMVERLRSLLGLGSPQPARPEPEADIPGEVSAKPAQQHSRDAQEPTLDTLSEALRVLSQAPAGDRPMPTSSPADEPADNEARTNISGGAMGMRINTTDAGEGGEDTPPDAPLSEPQSLLGERTARLGAQLNRLATDPTGERAAGESEGFYAASQAQAARVDFSSTPGAAGRSSETALSNQSVPVAYRATVKRYFLSQHGREQ